MASRETSEGVSHFDYTGLGELERAMLPDGREIAYRYDMSGRRVAKLVDGQIAERYEWADATRLLATYDGTGALTRRFFYADARTPYAFDTPAGRYFLAFDQTGSLRAVTDASGAVVKRVEHDSFGNLLADSDPDFRVPLGFAGGLADTDTGLTLFGARDYDPASGRWMAKDPIGFAGGDVNLYGYCLADPVNLVDPLGLDAAMAAQALAGGSAAAVGVASIDTPAPGPMDVVATVFEVGVLIGAGLMLLVPGDAFSSGGNARPCPTAAEWPYDPPGNNPDVAPVPGWIRHPSGNWLNPDNPGESMHPDLENGEEGPHWDWHNRPKPKERVDPETGELL